MLSKTALKKMKKDDLVAHILEGQEIGGRDALFPSTEKAHADAVSGEAMSNLIKQRAELREEIEELKETCMGMCIALQEATHHMIDDPTKFYRGIVAVEELCGENMTLKKENEKLLLTDEEQDSKIIDLEAEVEKIKKDLWSKPPGWRQIEKLKKEIKELKDGQEKTILETKVNAWRESMMGRQFSTSDTLEYITNECISGNKQLIKEVFDECEYPFYWDIEKDGTFNVEDDED